MLPNHLLPPIRLPRTGIPESGLVHLLRASGELIRLSVISPMHMFLVIVHSLISWITHGNHPRSSRFAGTFQCLAVPRQPLKLLETLERRVLKRLVIGGSTPSPGHYHSKELRGKSRDRMLAKSPTAITHA